MTKLKSDKCDDMGEGYVKNSEKSADVLYGRPLSVLRIGGILSLSFD